MNCELVKKNEIIPGIFDFWVKASEIAKSAKAGQFLHVICGEKILLRRPFCVCDTDGDLVRFIFAVRGAGTAELSKKLPGDVLDILGPLGTPFNPKLAAKNPPLLIGGGIGIFPLLKLSKEFAGHAHAILGFRNKDAVILEKEFANSCEKLAITTDDGSFGEKGFTTDVAEKWLNYGKFGAIYTCGPKIMMHSVARLGEKFNIPVEASLEERMACGVGACMGCVVNLKNGKNARVCKDGPVFDAATIDWD
jgi:dihydroorotate dehydrogenase electron transfer subunit